MTTTRRVAVLDVEAFHRACRLRGADTAGEIAEILGVHRTTVMRAMERQQRLGPHLLAAIYEAFGSEEAGTFIKIEQQAA